MARISEKKKEQIKALLATGLSQRKIAKQVNVALATVNKISQGEADEVEHLRTHKKQEWMNEAWKTINLYIEHVQTEEVIQRTGARDSAILIGTLHDKMIKNKELELKREELSLRKQELDHKLNKENDDDKPIEVVIKRKGDN